MERMDVFNHEKAIEKGSLVISTCGFNSIPAKLGLIFNSRQLVSSAALNSVDAYLVLESNNKIVLNVAAFESLVLGFANVHQLQQLRRSSPKQSRAHEIHGRTIKIGLGEGVYIQNALIYMYSSCGNAGTARQMFDKWCVRDLISWNTIIHGYVQEGDYAQVLDLFARMEEERVDPDGVTVVGLLVACGQGGDLQAGKQFHGRIKEMGLEVGVVLQTALVDMYSKCGCLASARDMFDKMLDQVSDLNSDMDNDDSSCEASELNNKSYTIWLMHGMDARFNSGMDLRFQYSQHHSDGTCTRAFQRAESFISEDKLHSRRTTKEGKKCKGEEIPRRDYVMKMSTAEESLWARPLKGLFKPYFNAL